MTYWAKPLPVSYTKDAFDPVMSLDDISAKHLVPVSVDGFI